MAKKLKICCLYILLPIITGVVSILFLPLPQYSGTHISPSRSYNPITITRDEYGVPTIKSKTFKDTLYGLGYAQAQDRLWTLHFRKLLVAGRTGEIFGSEGVIIDKFFRNLSLRRYCEGAYKVLDGESKEFLQAYVDGINDYAASVKVLPFQFWIFWTSFEEYTILDSLQSGKLLSFFLAMDFPFEFIFETVESLVGLEKALEIIPHREDKLLYKKAVILNDDELKQSGIYEPFNETLLYGEAETSRLEALPSERQPFAAVPCKGSSTDCLVDTQGPSSAEGLEKLQDALHHGIGGKLGEEAKAIKHNYNIGSNCWAIHGNHTTTGKPILASDPHLTNAMPSFWYNAELIYDGNHVSGMSLPGVPGITIGKSSHVAWGLTNLFADTSDIFTLNTKGAYYEYEGEWRPLRKIKEVIKVRGQSKPEEIYIFESHHGVVIDYHLAFPFAGMTFVPSPNKTYVLSWIGYTYSSNSIAPVLRLPEAKTASEILDIWKGSAEPSLSFVFATNQGDIGYVSLGKLPVRRRVSDGTNPRDGSKKENDWLGFVPWEDQPKVVNPRKGFIVSANNKISTDNVKWRVSANLMLTSRAARIEEMLREYIEKGRKISVEDTKKMQIDTLDILAREIVPTIQDDLTKALENEGLSKHLKASKPQLLSLIAKLRTWDYRMEIDSVPAGIFGVWQNFFLRKVLRKIGLNEEDRHSIIGCFKIDHFVYRKLIEMDKSPNGFNDYWCQSEDNTVMTDQSCLFILIKALDETWDYFQKKVGNDIEKWTWGSVHTMEYPHEPFNMTPLKPLFQRSRSAPGNTRTVFVSGMQPAKDGYEGIWSPNTRMVASLRKGDKSYFVIDTGMSDNVMSEHYDDQMGLYYKNGYIEMNEKSPAVWKDKLEIQFGKKDIDL